MCIGADLLLSVAATAPPLSAVPRRPPLPPTIRVSHAALNTYSTTGAGIPHLDAFLSAEKQNLPERHFDTVPFSLEFKKFSHTIIRFIKVC